MQIRQNKTGALAPVSFKRGTWFVLRHFPPHPPKQRRNFLLVTPLVRGCIHSSMLLRHLLAVVLELLLLDALPGFFRRHDGRALVLTPTVVAALALPLALALARLGRRLRTPAAFRPLLAVALVPLGAARPI